MTTRIPLSEILALFDRHVAEMRARLEVEPSSVSWSDDVSGRMSIEVKGAPVEAPE